ncbi:MAG: TolC family protein [Candidatus Cloacimonetes bacterium]|nr:TolC family protein [Candidatus Cloacimonadota bacterium]
MKIFSLITLLGLSLFLSASELTLQDARALLLSNNLELQAAEASSQASANSETASLYNLFPQASLTSSCSRSEAENTSPDNRYGYGVNISQNIFSGGKYWLSYKIAGLNSDLEKQKYLQTRFRLLAELESNFYNLLKAEEMLKLAELNNKSAVELQKIALIRFQADNLAEADYLQFESQKANREIELVQAQNELLIQSRQMQMLLSLEYLPKAVSPEIKDWLNEIEEISRLDLNDISALIEAMNLYLQKVNPELVSTNIEKEIAAKSKLISLGEFLPKLSLNWSWNNSAENLEDDFNESRQLSLNFSIPLLPAGSNLYNYKQKCREFESVSLSNASQLLEAELEMQQTIYALLTNARSYKAAQISLTAAQQTYELNQDRFKRGIISSTDLLTSEIQFVSAQHNLTEKLYDFQNNKTVLKQLLLIETDENLWQIFEL